MSGIFHLTVFRYICLQILERKHDLIQLADYCEELLSENAELRCRLAQSDAECTRVRQHGDAIEHELAKLRTTVEQYEFDCTQLREQLTAYETAASLEDGCRDGDGYFVALEE